MQTQKAPASAQMCGVWAASKGSNGAIFGGKWAGKEENKPDFENPLMGETFSHDKLTKLSARILRLEGTCREVAPIPSLAVFKAWMDGALSNLV